MLCLIENLAELSNILVTNIYSDIRFYQFFFYIYIWTLVRIKFVCLNIFGYSFVSVLECKNQMNIRIYLNVHTIFTTNTYSAIRSFFIQICSDIHLCPNFHECHTLKQTHHLSYDRVHPPTSKACKKPFLRHNQISKYGHNKIKVDTI